VPFHYFGVSDNVDPSQLERKRGNYDTAQLSNFYTGNDARAAKVIRELRDKVTSTEQMRAIGFCVSVQYAHYMAEVFNRDRLRRGRRQHRRCRPRGGPGAGPSARD
jgi:hypothetical protein